MDYRRLAENALFGRRRMTEATLLLYVRFKRGRSMADFEKLVKEVRAKWNTLSPVAQELLLAEKLPEILDMRADQLRPADRNQAGA